MINKKLFLLMFLLILLPAFSGCNEVRFGTPYIISSNGASIKNDGVNSYSVNKSDTVVAVPFNIGNYMSFTWESNSPTTGNFSSTNPYYKSGCINYTTYDEMKEKAQLTIKSSNDYSRKVRITAYSQKNCNGESKQFISQTFSYKAETPDDGGLTLETKSDGNQYYIVPDKSNGAWRKIGTQGFYTATCNCYTKAYALSMTLNRTLNPNKYGTKSEDAKKCWDSGFGGNYYLTEDINAVASKSDAFGIIRNSIVDDKLPVMVLVYNSTGNTHFLLAFGIKKDSINKSKSSLTYSDFWVADPVGSNSQPTTSESPKEKNWQTLINAANGDANNRKLYSADGKYKVTEMNK